MNEREPEGGTPEEIVDDSENAGTPASLDGAESDTSEDSKVTISRGELGVWKTKAERVNTLEKQIAVLEARAESKATDRNGSEASEQRKTVDKLQNYLQRLDVAADSGNEEADALRTVYRGSLAAEQRTLYRLEMYDVPEAERDEVKSFMRDNGLHSPAVAQQLLRGGTKYHDLQKQVDRLTKELETTKKPTPKIESRVVGESRARVHQESKNGEEMITLAEYTERMNDPARRSATKVARDGGRLKFKN